MYEKVDKVNLARHYIQVGTIFCANTNNKITLKNPLGTAVGIIVVPLFI